MRKLFAGTFVVSTALAVIVGVAFAWTTTVYDRRQITIGTLQISLANIQPTDTPLVPTGELISVMTGQIRNDSTTPVRYLSGNINRYSTSNESACPSQLLMPNLAVENDAPIPPGETGDLWIIQFSLDPMAPPTCQGVAVDFDFAISATTDVTS